MKVVILCGGLGTRLREETDLKPKPMVEIGGKPILWHIMKMYGAQGFTDFVVALGYKGHAIKEYFLNYYYNNADFTVDLASGTVEASRKTVENWRVTLVDTGEKTMTGGRIARLRHVLGEQPFLLTYGDGVANVDIKAVAKFHASHGKVATVTAVRPAARFGNIVFDGELVREFKEKPQTGEGWINGGFFVFNAGIFDYLQGDAVPLEEGPLENLSRAGQLMAYRHEGFWHCMDTIRDRNMLEGMWSAKDCPWKTWKDT